MSHTFLQFNSCHSSMIVKLKPSPEILYWGKALQTLDEDSFIAFQHAIDRGVMQARLDNDVPLTLCPENGRGMYSAPGIEGHRNGENWAPIFAYGSHTINDQKIEINCQDKIAGLALKINLSMDPISGVVEKLITVINSSAQPYQLNKLALTLPLPYRAKEVQSFHGRWSKEFQSQRATFEHGAFVQENRRGRTSHEYFPGCLVGSKAFSEQQGEVWGFHLGWSGNHHWRAEAKSDGRRFIQAGEILFPGEIILQQGESYSTPSLYANYSNSGLNGIRSNFHHYVRNKIIHFPSDKPRPVHLNTWEGIYFDHDPEYIKQMATEAAKMGVERFIIDDGWFKGRNDDKAALGDWTLDRGKYPLGLEPVIQHVNQQGMEFGIWVEPEMVNEDSDLFRAHSDWMLALEGYTQPTGRFQYVLNLQIEACFNYLFDSLDTILSRYNVAYLKWDMNRELVQPSHNGKAAVHGQTKAVYRLIDKLRQTHPDVEIESCSSGGGRIDFEILKRTHRFWVSDCNDALERQTIQNGMNIFFPPEVMGAHIGPHKSHTTRRQHDINLRGLTALAGHMGVELDPVKEPDAEKKAFAKYIALHKRFRALLHSGKSFYLDSTDKTKQAYGVYSDQELLLTVCQLAMPEYMLPEPILFGMLDSNALYKLEIVEFPMHSAALMKTQPQWVNLEDKVFSGEWLNEVGLCMPILDPEASMLLHLAKLA
jgi:alpha-galactosidase